MDRLTSFEHLPFVDPSVSQHGPPGSPEVVVGVEDVLGSEDGVLFGHFECGDCYLSFRIVEKLREYEVTGPNNDLIIIN